MQHPGVELHFLWAEGAALVDVIEPHAVGGQLDHRGQLLLQLSYRLVQTDVQLRHRKTVLGKANWLTSVLASPAC